MTDTAAPSAAPVPLLRLRNRQGAVWLAGAAVVALVIAAPIFAILVNLGQPAPDVW